MTTPEVPAISEDFGSLEVFGIPFSTFTRTITMALEELGMGKDYIQHKARPHSKEVLQHNPFGLLPVLIHRPDALYSSADDVVVLYETNAIRRYIDEFIAPTAARKYSKAPRLTPPAPAHGSLEDSRMTLQMVTARAEMDQWVSIASSILFPVIENAVVKPRCAMEANGADDATVRVGIEEGISRLEEKFSILENQLVERTDGHYLCGKDVTWADLYVFPPCADLRSVPEGDLIKGSNAKYPKISAWMDRMEARASAKATHQGTLAAQRGL